MSINNPTTYMSKRINIILPDKTASVLDRVTTKGRRSEFISRAVLHFVETAGRGHLRARLKREAIANAERDLALAVEWFPLEEEIAKAQSVAKQRSTKPTRKRP
jgi:CopG family transcriptional regulator / antitoxin EndoAI